MPIALETMNHLKLRTETGGIPLITVTFLNSIRARRVINIAISTSVNEETFQPHQVTTTESTGHLGAGIVGHIGFSNRKNSQICKIYAEMDSSPVKT